MTYNVPVVRPGWPTQPSSGAPPPQGWQGYSYPAAPAPHASTTHRLSHSRLLSALLGGLAGAVLVITVLSLVVKSSPPAPCVSLVCLVRPPIGPPVENGTLYSNPTVKFTARILSIGGVTPSISTTKGTLTLSYDADGTSLGVLSLAGMVDNGLTAEQIVNDEINKIANGAQLAYVIPGSMIGYQPGFGAAYNFTPDTGAGKTATDRVIVLASVRDGVAIVSVASGPKVQFSSTFPDGQLSIADSIVAALGDPVLNSVVWPGQTAP